MIVSFSEVLCCCLKRKYILSFCMLTSHGLPSLVVSCVVWKSHKSLWAWARPWAHPSKQGQVIGFWQSVVGLILLCPLGLCPCPGFPVEKTRLPQEKSDLLITSLFLAASAVDALLGQTEVHRLCHACSQTMLKPCEGPIAPSFSWEASAPSSLPFAF